MTRNLPLATRGLATATLALAATAASAQNFATWNLVGPGDWNNGANWSPFGAVPDAVNFGEQAVINNGGTAFLTAATADVGGVTLGQAGQSTGALEIRSGGALKVVRTTGGGQTTTGVVTVNAGAGVSGTLTVDRGGSLTTRTLISGGGASLINLGGGAGVGNATVNVTEAARLQGASVIGRDVTFTAGQLEFGGGSALGVEVTSTGNAMLNATGIANLAGTLTLSFNGVTPTTANSFTIVDAAAITRTFNTINSSAPLGPGLRLVQQIVPAGARQQLQVSVDEVLTLQIERRTGLARLVSESGSPVEITAYNSTSNAGAINPAYSTLASQNLGGFQTTGTGPTATQAAELSPAGGLSIGAAGVSLGTYFAQPALPAFGIRQVDDLVFNYVRASDGRTFNPIIQYDSPAIENNLVLTIDPATGNARLTNESATNLDIDAYSIGSTNSALLTGWNSLQDRAFAGWLEANPTAGRVSELNPTGSLSVPAGASVNLNGLLTAPNTALASTDFAFEFRDTTLGERTGVIRFAALTAGIPGDYTNDGIVNAADYTRWRDAAPTATLPNDTTPGVVTRDDYNVWRNAFGTRLITSASSFAAAVPEPTSLASILGAALSMLFVGRRRVAVAQSFQPATESAAMKNRFVLAGVAVIASSAAAVAQPVTIGRANMSATPSATFTDGSITLSAFGPGGVPVPFGPGGVGDLTMPAGSGTAGIFIGPDSRVTGDNVNAINDVDGDPSTTGDRESLQITLASSVSLIDVRFSFSRANPILISGFGSDPLATFASNPSNNGTLAYSNGTLSIFQNLFGGNTSIVAFNNPAATDGRTLTTTVTDFFQGSAQVAFTGFTYDPNPTTLLPGDVDGLNGVTIDDFNIIRANFFTNQTRALGDLTGDGFVNLPDFAQWEANFPGSTAGFASLLPIPEPSVLALVGCGLVGMGFAARRR